MEVPAPGNKAPTPQGKRTAATATPPSCGTSAPRTAPAQSLSLQSRTPARPVLSGVPRAATPQGGSTGAQQTPPVMSLHRVSGGVYLLRLYDAAYTECGIAAMKTLRDASSLIIVTPTETKTFEIARVATPPQARVSAGVRDAAVDVDVAEIPEEELDEETRAAIAAETGEAAPDPMEEAMALAERGEQEHDQSPGVRRRAPRQENVGNSPCGRCSGQGTIKTPLEGGGFVDGTCPVCRGRGTIQRYGATPRR